MAIITPRITLVALLTVVLGISSRGHAQEQPQPTRTVEYKSIGDVRLHVHLFEPADHRKTDERAAIVFFFGGGWNGGSPSQFYPHCAHLASRGMVAMAAEYRVKNRHGTTPFECVMDGKSVIRWIRTHASELGIDPDRVAAGGGSAGGHVAAAIATVPGLDEPGEDLATSAVPDALVLFNPVYDNGPLGYGHARVRDRYEEISPIHNIRPGMPPAIVFLGTKDALIPVATADTFKAKMEGVGSRSELMLFKGAPHGFFNYGRGDGQAYRDTVRAMDTFLESLGFLTADATPRDRPNILFCIADDWGWRHASAYGDPVVQTPAFDRIAREGVLFEHAYVSSPSCTPSRNSILTGQYHWRLGPGANLWSWLDRKHPVYPLLLRDAGYHVGFWRKSWGPGKLELGGYEEGEHPAGTRYPKGLASFLADRPADAPFCFWLGASDPHRGYTLGSGRASGMNIDDVPVPGFYPDVEQIRSDIADYYFEVQRFDRDVAAAIQLLEDAGELEDTIVVITGDHGMPFPRCKANLYDMGVRVPLAIRWGRNIELHEGEAAIGERVDALVSLVDLAPTFLTAAAVDVPDVMSGVAMQPLVAATNEGRSDAPWRTHVVFGRERHTAGRPGGGGYPARGIRTASWSYIRNYEPNRWPAADPPNFADCDPHNGVGANLTKGWILQNRDSPDGRRFYEWSFAKRPAEELYDMVNDPDQLNNLSDDPEYASQKARLAALLNGELRATGDPRALDERVEFDSFPYFGGGVWRNPEK